MKTYRYSGHSRSDPATYRPAGELDLWLKRDPIALFAAALAKEGVIASDDLEKIPCRHGAAHGDGGGRRSRKPATYGPRYAVSCHRNRRPRWSSSSELR